MKIPYSLIVILALIFSALACENVRTLDSIEVANTNEDAFDDTVNDFPQDPPAPTTPVVPVDPSKGQSYLSCYNQGLSWLPVLKDAEGNSLPSECGPTIIKDAHCKQYIEKILPFAFNLEFEGGQIFSNEYENNLNPAANPTYVLHSVESPVRENNGNINENAVALRFYAYENNPPGSANPGFQKYERLLTWPERATEITEEEKQALKCPPIDPEKVKDVE